MLIQRKFVIPVLAVLILLGLAMAFDQKFLSFSDMMRNPLSGIFIYFPSLLFAFVGLLQFRRGRTWPAAAFTIGLIATGVFHQVVVESSHGNPGYMFPAGHILAPFVSFIAYSASFLVSWAVARICHRGSRPESPNEPDSGGNNEGAG